MASRTASHAGSWYSESQAELDGQLRSWLSNVDVAQIPPPGVSATDEQVQGEAELQLPIQGVKAVIAPHAGYAYSGPAAAWAYATIPAQDYDRVFILGPSHHVWLDGCALTRCKTYQTPIGALEVDLETTAELRATGNFTDMSQSTDEDEHSIELHLPYVRKVWQGKPIKIVPVLVGSLSASKQDFYGEILAPYLADPKTFFVVSSDFCHWGTRFSYTAYRHPDQPALTSLSNSSKPSASLPIHTSIRSIDADGMSSLSFPAAPPLHASSAAPTDKTAKEAKLAFEKYIRETKNTVCGRHPIGVLMSALTELESQGTQAECRFTRYEQSSQVTTLRDSSVSYASAFVRFTS